MDLLIKYECGISPDGFPALKPNCRNEIQM